MTEQEPGASLAEGTPTTDMSATDLAVLFGRDASVADRGRALQAFGATVRVRLQDVTSAAGQNAEAVAERSGHLLAEVVDRLPIRRAEDLRREYGVDPQSVAEQVIDDAVTLARWLWVATKAIPAPELAVHAAKVVLHSSIEIRMVGELLEARRDPDANVAATPLPAILAAWAAGAPEGPAWSPGSVAAALVTQVRRALNELRGSDGRIRGVINRGREGGDVVRNLGERVNSALRQRATTPAPRTQSRVPAEEPG